jgi:hypothetical protein
MTGRNLLALLLGLAAGVAVAVDWYPIAVTVSGTWTVDRTSMSVGSDNGLPSIAARVRREPLSKDSESIFLATLDPGACTAKRGQLVLVSTDGKASTGALIFSAGDGTAADAIASAMCRLYLKK